MRLSGKGVFIVSLFLFPPESGFMGGYWLLTTFLVDYDNYN